MTKHTPRCQADQGDPHCPGCAEEAHEAQELAAYLDAQQEDDPCPN